ncbi:MAG: zeta toxin family protein [Methylococcaceae bacterium]
MSNYLKQIYKCWHENPAQNDSFEKYANDNGDFTKERQDLHNEIISNSVKRIRPNENFVICFIGGPPAVGKSKFIDEKIGVKNKLIINTDEIKKLLPGYDSLGGSYLHRESFVIAEHILHKGLTLGLDVVIETTGKGPYDLLINRINSIKLYGAIIDAHYLIAPLEILLQRANARQVLINRHTPAGIIKNSLASIHNCLPRLIKSGVFNSITVWDTEKDNCFVELLTKKNDHAVIHDKKTWKALYGECINE